MQASYGNQKVITNFMPLGTCSYAAIHHILLLGVSVVVSVSCNTIPLFHRLYLVFRHTDNVKESGSIKMGEVRQNHQLKEIEIVQSIYCYQLLLSKCFLNISLLQRC